MSIIKIVSIWTTHKKMFAFCQPYSASDIDVLIGLCILVDVVVSLVQKGEISILFIRFNFLKLLFSDIPGEQVTPRLHYGIKNLHSRKVENDGCNYNNHNF
jgi:hypothetical protein